MNAVLVALSSAACGLSAVGCLHDSECAEGETCVLAGAGPGGHCRRGDAPTLTNHTGRGGLPVFSRRDGGRVEPGAVRAILSRHRDEMRDARPHAPTLLRAPVLGRGGAAASDAGVGVGDD